VKEQGPAIAQLPVSTAGRRRWHFGRATLDERALELLVDGVDTELERKPLEVLIYLLQHAGEVCTKEELLAGIWPGRVLSETVLTKCIGRLREVLEDNDQEIIKTAYGFGYRVVAPVHVEAVATPEPARFDLCPGVHPPSRPLWSLTERLGSGGHGEAWKARHDKTNEQRVFKFALAEPALVALKREITLFRVINDTLGDYAKVVKLLDWNLEQVPYFVEAEFIAGGNLVDWVSIRGGVGGIPLVDRLEIVAKIAEALAAVHSVGVLHKDLKPSNVLIRPSAGNEIEVLLGDFGSGGVLNANRLEELGITRLGFTKTVSSTHSSSVTPLYLAPEILAGQPHTVKSDIYALGIILYQFLAGDFRKVMSPGWERDIDDELLRDDIALMAEGDPVERLGDASGLTRRLRSLDERRRQLEAEREAKLKADRVRRLLERSRARRFGLMVAIVALFAGTIVSTALYIREREAQRRTSEAAAQSKAVTEFLSKDVFAPASSGMESVKTLSVGELLARAGDKIDTRFAAQPPVAAELHYVIGKSLNDFYETRAAVNHFNKALALQSNLQGAGSEAAVKSAAELVYLDSAVGKLGETIAGYERSYDSGRIALGPRNQALLDLRERIAFGHFILGDWKGASLRLGDTLSDLAQFGLQDAVLTGHGHLYFGEVLTALGNYRRACSILQSGVVELTKGLGPGHPDVADAKSAFGMCLVDLGEYERGLNELREAETLATKWEPLDVTWTVVRPRFFQARAFLEQGQPEKARLILMPIIDFQNSHAAGAKHVDRTASVRQALGEVYLLQDEAEKAVDTLREALRVSELSSGYLHPTSLSIRFSLAKALLIKGDPLEARAILGDFLRFDPTGLPETHPFIAQLLEARGLLAHEERNDTTAKELLERAKTLYQALYGETHWRTLGVKQSLSMLSTQ
jgi:serine/threonine protein kinase/DNA-binding winged helix-turn-helix (wHTH) protein